MGSNRYKLKMKKLGLWLYVRDGFKVKIFEDFSSVVNYLQQLRK